ncbi:hypothetical protein AX15_004614 [Amanita polypyramis BW_CC]|nr:hypothetical protein AX15_004614 [Amanita polypyramis BW_CC]
MTSAVLEYPLDLAKVRLQAQLLYKANSVPLRFNGPWDCLVKTWKHEGVRGLYRGLPAPVVGSMVETSAIFLSYTYFQNLIRSFSDAGKDLPLSIPQLALAAGGAGFVTSFLLTPIELVKCRMQVHMMNMSIYTDPPSARNLSTSAAHVSKPTLIFSTLAAVNGLEPSPTASPAQSFTSDAHVSPSPRGSPVLGMRKPEGPWTILSSVARSHGIRGLWLGHTGTMLRETGGSSIWFSIKEWIAAWLREQRLRYDISSGVPEKGNGDLLPWESALAGALAGGVSTLVLYPVDTVKSAVQTEDEFRIRPSSSQPSPATVTIVRPDKAADTFLTVTKRMYAANGIRGFYAGCGMTIARAVPGSAVVFVVYDGLSAWLA